jgi:hypothetical protein
MTNLAVEIFDDELPSLEGKDFVITTAKGRNFDGIDVNTVLMSITSAATLKTVCSLIASIVKARRSGKIKLNGVELSGVTEETIQRLLQHHEPKSGR